GTRMVIDEPDTPFIKETARHGDSDEEDTRAQPKDFGNELAEMLEKLTVTKEGTVDREEADSQLAQERSRQAFKDKRKNHYNEFQAVKVLGKDLTREDEDE
ncbi:hypothetical protein FOZ61_000905, partial [Perkinsus olseni]